MLVRVLPGVVEVMVGERLIVSSQVWRRMARSSISVWVVVGVGDLVEGNGELKEGVGYLGGRQGSSPGARGICTSSDLRTSDTT